MFWSFTNFSWFFKKSQIHLLMQLSKRHLVDKTVIKSIKIEHYLWDLIGNKIPKNSLNFAYFSFGLLIRQLSGSYFPTFSGLPLIHLRQFWCLCIQKVQLYLQNSIIDLCIFGIGKLQNYPWDCKMCRWRLLLIPKISENNKKWENIGKNLKGFFALGTFLKDLF